MFSAYFLHGRSPAGILEASRRNGVLNQYGYGSRSFPEFAFLVPAIPFRRQENPRKISLTHSSPEGPRIAQPEQTETSMHILPNVTKGENRDLPQGPNELGFEIDPTKGKTSGLA